MLAWDYCSIQVNGTCEIEIIFWLLINISGETRLFLVFCIRSNHSCKLLLCHSPTDDQGCSSFVWVVESELFYSILIVSEVGQRLRVDSQRLFIFCIRCSAINKALLTSGNVVHIELEDFTAHVPCYPGGRRKIMLMTTLDDDNSGFGRVGIYELVLEGRLRGVLER